MATNNKKEKEMNIIKEDMPNNGVRFKFREGDRYVYDWTDPINTFSETDELYIVNNHSFDYEFKKSEVVSYFIYEIGENDYDFNVSEVSK